MVTTEKKLTGKVAIVTGGSKGIGAAIAKHLADEGAAVVVNYASSKEGADRVVAEISGKGGKAIAVQANVAKEADVSRLFSEATKACGQLDILVNNAGIYEFAPLENVTAEHFHKMFDLNVLGLILASQEAAKHFGASGCNIVNISSVAAVARQRVGAAKHPRQLDQSWHGRNGGTHSAGITESEFRRRTEENAARPDRSAAGHRTCRRVSGVSRFGVDHW